MSAHTSSQPRRADLGKSQDEVAAMFDDVSQRYDVMNALLSGGMNFVWMKALTAALKPRPSDYILDLAAGTGASSVAIARSGARVVACDLSAGMIEVGRARHPEVDFVQGDAMNLPFADNTFDAVTISYGLRNVPDPKRALEDVSRDASGWAFACLRVFDADIGAPARGLLAAPPVPDAPGCALCFLGRCCL